MATITFKGSQVHTTGSLPARGQRAPAFSLLRQDLSRATRETFKGRRLVLNVFPSIDTPVCAASVRTFNQRAASLPNAVVLNVSADLPFAAKRFCGAEGLQGVETLSTFKSTFATDYGLEIQDGPLAGLCSRAVLVLDADGTVLYGQQVPDIAQEPDYDAALAALGARAKA
jgi:thiol peroxidase